MDGETILAVLTLVLSFAGTVITLLVRADLIRQGKDIKELKAEALKARPKE